MIAGSRKLALLVLVAGLAAAASAAAAPTVGEKRAEAERVFGEIQEIDAELDRAVDAYNGATERLAALQGEIRVNRRHLAIARGAYEVATARLSDRLVALYMAGEESWLEVIIGSSSLDDLIDRVDAAKRVSAQDAQILEEVRKARDEIKSREARLDRARAEQKRVVAERAARREAIEGMLAERRRLYDSIKAEIAEFEAQERARQRRLQEEARRRLEEEQRAAAAAPAPVEIPSPAGLATAPPSGVGGQVVEIALRYLGIPYKWGGASPSEGFDCSGLVLYVYAQVGISLPHYTGSQWQLGVPVARDQLQPGDVVFFNGISHNGIYIGGGQFVQAPRTGDVVKISSLSEPWYASVYEGARRYL